MRSDHRFNILYILYILMSILWSLIALRRIVHFQALLKSYLQSLTETVYLFFRVLRYNFLDNQHGRYNKIT